MKKARNDMAEISAIALLALLLWSIPGFHDAVDASLHNRRLTLFETIRFGVFVLIGVGAAIAFVVLTVQLRISVS